MAERRVAAVLAGRGARCAVRWRADTAFIGDERPCAWVTLLPLTMCGHALVQSAKEGQQAFSLAAEKAGFSFFEIRKYYFRDRNRVSLGESGPRAGGCE